MPKNVLSLGQCAADNYTITQFLEGNFGAQVTPVDTFPEALENLRAGGYDLVLVNRLLDRNGASGLAFIKQLKENAALANLPVMLVSNHADAQQQAVAHGALPGFGKGALRDTRTIERVRAVLGESRD